MVEIVSPGSAQRDYIEKREDYLRFGVTEYWIIDAAKEQLLVLSRSGDSWSETTIGPPNVHATDLLPGFSLDVANVFEMARRLR